MTLHYEDLRNASDWFTHESTLTNQRHYPDLVRTASSTWNAEVFSQDIRLGSGIAKGGGFFIGYGTNIQGMNNSYLYCSTTLVRLSVAAPATI